MTAQRHAVHVLKCPRHGSDHKTIHVLIGLSATALTFSRAPHKEVFKEEPSFAPMEWRTTANACYFVVVRGRWVFDPDNFISRPAMGAVKRCWLTHGHMPNYTRSPFRSLLPHDFKLRHYRAATVAA